MSLLRKAPVENDEKDDCAGKVAHVTKTRVAPGVGHTAVKDKTEKAIPVWVL
jgi:hypothetical protein